MRLNFKEIVVTEEEIAIWDEVMFDFFPNANASAEELEEELDNWSND